MISSNTKPKVKSGIISLFLMAFLAPLTGQYNVIHIEGKAYYKSEKDTEMKYNELSFGPLNDAQSIVLKDRTQVILINDKNEVCTLSEGEYQLDEITCAETKNKSGFEKFCDYFKSFFLHHNAAESKKYYVNNIHAITRGEKQPPILDFPLEGNLSFDLGYIPFMWTHGADSTEYIFTIQELNSNEIVFSSMTTELLFELRNPEKYLQTGQSYYWSVKVAGQENNVEYNKSVIEISPDKEALNILQSVIPDNSSTTDQKVSTADFIFILSQLEEKGYENEAIIYGLDRMKNTSSNSERMIFENFMYDIIAEINLTY